LKPAPTRLRLLLWSLASGLQEFPEAPPPGLVTVLTDDKAPAGYHLKSGYRAAGERALRVDMAERLADMLRAQDTRGGFEATADMLSITGMTLEQFANLMQGLSYRAEKSERVKVKAVPVVDTAEAVTPETGSATTDEAPAPEVVPEVVAKAASVIEADLEQPVDMEVFYTFAWGARRPERNADAPRKNTKPRGKPQNEKGAKGKGGKGPRRDTKVESFQVRSLKHEKPIDPDNPFAAALMGFNKK
jgi:ATP-dependent RNA helicase SUPV3L1/SUV3